jgi:hypothetical protein
LKPFDRSYITATCSAHGLPREVRQAYCALSAAFHLLEPPLEILAIARAHAVEVVLVALPAHADARERHVRGQVVAVFEERIEIGMVVLEEIPHDHQAAARAASDLPDRTADPADQRCARQAVADGDRMPGHQRRRALRDQHFQEARPDAAQAARRAVQCRRQHLEEIGGDGVHAGVGKDPAVGVVDDGIEEAAVVDAGGFDRREVGVRTGDRFTTGDFVPGLGRDAVDAVEDFHSPAVRLACGASVLARRACLLRRRARLHRPQGPGLDRLPQEFGIEALVAHGWPGG